MNHRRRFIEVAIGLGVGSLARNAVAYSRDGKASFFPYVERGITSQMLADKLLGLAYAKGDQVGVAYSQMNPRFFEWQYDKANALSGVQFLANRDIQRAMISAALSIPFYPAPVYIGSADEIALRAVGPMHVDEQIDRLSRRNVGSQARARSIFYALVTATAATMFANDECVRLLTELNGIEASSSDWLLSFVRRWFEMQDPEQMCRSFASKYTHALDFEYFSDEVSLGQSMNRWRCQEGLFEWKSSGISWNKPEGPVFSVQSKLAGKRPYLVSVTNRK